MRSDSLLTTLGDRTSGLRRLWVEDSFSRLSNNGFRVGTGFVVEPRLGPGVNLRPASLGACHVSQRRGAAILSYEGSENLRGFVQPEVRVKISVNLVEVLPSLRAFSVREPSTVTWKIRGTDVITPAGTFEMRTGFERPAGRPMIIDAELDHRNLVAATALIAWAKPGTVKISVSPSVVAGQLEMFSEAKAGDDAIVEEVARQFLVSCGWEQTAPGLYRR